MSVPTVSELRFVAVGQDDPLAEPLLAELARGVRQPVRRTGGGGVEVAARLSGRRVRGTRRRHADRTAATASPSPAARSAGSTPRRPSSSASGPTAGIGGRGYAKALLVELEAEIAARGYRRIYLTTGDRQPEAEELYLSTGYTRLAEPLPAEGEVYPDRVREGCAP